MKKLISTIILLLTLSQMAYGMSADEYYQSGKEKLSSNNYKGAIADLTKAIDIEPASHADYYYQRSVAKSWADDIQGALSDMDKAISIDAKQYKYYYNRSIIKSGLDDYKGCIADLRKTLDLHFDLAYIAKLNKTIDIAEQKEHPEAYTYYASGIKKAKNGDYRGAIDDYNKAIELSPSYGDYYFSRSNAKDNLKDHQGALDDAKNAARCNNYESRYYYSVGNALTWFNEDGGNMSNIVAFYGVAARYNTESTNADRYSKALKEAQTLYDEMKAENARAMECLEFYTEEGYYGGLMLHNRCNRKITAALSSKYNSEYYVFLEPNKSQRIGPANGDNEDRILRAWMYGNGYSF